jgi:DNA-binding NarL/FixJ family response regulator
MHDSDEMATRALAAGIRGLVLKSDAARDLVLAVEALSQHKPFLSAWVTEMILTGYTESPTGVPRCDLTLRELQILKLVAQGKTDKEVAAALSISQRAVGVHRAAIVRKLNLHSASDLVQLASGNKIARI